MKPEDIPQIVWDEAFHEMDCHCPEAMMGEESLQQSVHTAIARSILQARSQACEECAKIAEGQFLNTDVLFSMPSQSSAAWNIAQAIRQHSQKGEDK